MSKQRPIYSTTNPFNKYSAFSSSHQSSNQNFQPNFVDEDRGGTQPIAPPSSVSLVLVTMILHICKKSLLFEPRLKVCVYFVAVIIGSCIVEVKQFPKTYFARSNNIFNRVFVNWAWSWLLVTTGSWVVIMAHTLGCGKRSALIKHLKRLLFATLAWMFWTNIFHYVETNYGQCVNTKNRFLQTKSKCLQAGLFWGSFDISGHAFILIYSSLILSEEGYSLLGWEGIGDFIMKKEHNKQKSSACSLGCLQNLSDSDYDLIKKSHKALTPYVRGLFIIMTIQQILCDVMLVATILYFHILIEKFAGAVAAIFTWYVSYYWLFGISELGMILPGEEIFKNNQLKEKHKNSIMRSKRSVPNKGSTFMRKP